jgi:hypothetical protein
MAFPRLDIVDTDETTVLWSFNDQLGAVNPNAVRSKLGPIDFGVRTEITTVEYPGSTGGQVSAYRDAVAAATLHFYPGAATADALATGLGVLTKLLARGGVMIWQRSSGSALRYIDFLPSPRVSLYRGQHITDLADLGDGVILEILMQPYLRGALVTTSAVNVPNDPATANGRIYLVNAVTGDLPTPASINATMDTGSNVERVHIAHRAQGTGAATALTDYVSETAFTQCEASGRGWTVSLGTDTAGATDANASPGSGTSVARCTYATAATMTQRMRITRTTKMDSLRGAWDPWVRMKASAASLTTHQLKWGPNAAGPVVTLGEVPHDTSAASSFGYVEKKLGTIHIPETVPLAGLALELWSRRDSGTGNIDYDYLFLTPHDEQGTVVSLVSGLVVNESAKTQPGARYTVDRIDVNGNVNGFLGVEGEIPSMLQPGNNHLVIRTEETPLANYTEHNILRTRTPLVTVSYAPRYAL